MTGKQKSAYRRTEEFKNKKRFLFEYYNWTCQICGIRKLVGLHPHHYDNETYEKEVPLTDLIPLCSSCHREIERLLRRTKNKIDIDDYCSNLKKIYTRSK